MQEFLDFLGHGFCHQIHERTLEAGGVFFSVCARDTGIYLGLVVTVLVICLLYRWRAARMRRAALTRREALIRREALTCRETRMSGEVLIHREAQMRVVSQMAGIHHSSLYPGDLYPSGLPPLPIIVIAIILALPVAIDGLTSYAGLRETTNLIRFFTGYAAGMAVGLLASCVVMGLFRGSSDGERVLAVPRIAILTLILSPLAALVFWLIYPSLGLVAPLLIATAFLVIIVMLNVVLLAMNRHLRLPLELPAGEVSHKFAACKRWLIVLAMAICLAVIQITLFGLARDLIFLILFNGDITSIAELL